MKSHTIVPGGTTYSNPQYRKPSGGDDGKKGPPTSSKNRFDINDFDFTGEPQKLSGVSNLSPDFTSEDSSQTKSDPSQLQFDTLVSIDDGSREANSASEDSELEPKPAPLSTTTTPGLAQPTVKLSDDPAVATLEQAQLNCTLGVAFYAQLLGILDKALADNPQLPRNSFDGLKHTFLGAQTECATRAAELTKDATQLRNDRVAQAQALAAKAQGIGTPIAPAASTFSATPKTPISDVKLDQLTEEVARLPEPEQRDQIIEGMRLALKDEPTVSDADLARAMRQLHWDLDNPGMNGVDPELGDLYMQLQASADLDALEQQPIDMKNMPFTADHDDSDLDDLTRAATNGSVLGPTASQQPADLDAEQNALLAEVEAMQSPADSKSSINTVSPPQIPYAQDELTKPVNVSPEDLAQIEFEGLRSFASQIDELQQGIAHARSRKFTANEEKEHQKLLQAGGSSAEFREKLVKPELIEIVKNFQATQHRAIADIQAAVIEIGSGKLMSDASQYDRKLHLAKLQGQKKTLQFLIDTGDRLIRGF